VRGAVYRLLGDSATRRLGDSATRPRVWRFRTTGFVQPRWTFRWRIIDQFDLAFGIDENTALVVDGCTVWNPGLSDVVVMDERPAFYTFSIGSRGRRRPMWWFQSMVDS